MHPLFAVALQIETHCVCSVSLTFCLAVGVCALTCRCVDTPGPSVSVTVGRNAFKRPRTNGGDAATALLTLMGQM